MCMHCPSLWALATAVMTLLPWGHSVTSECTLPPPVRSYRRNLSGLRSHKGHSACFITSTHLPMRTMGFPNVFSFPSTSNKLPVICCPQLHLLSLTHGLATRLRDLKACSAGLHTWPGLLPGMPVCLSETSTSFQGKASQSRQWVVGQCPYQKLLWGPMHETMRLWCPIQTAGRFQNSVKSALKSRLTYLYLPHHWDYRCMPSVSFLCLCWGTQTQVLMLEQKVLY